MSVNWSNLQIGKQYQIKEGSIVYEVVVISDSSSEEYYEYTVIPIYSSADEWQLKEFTIGCSAEGAYSYLCVHIYDACGEYLYKPKGDYSEWASRYLKNLNIDIQFKKPHYTL